MTPKSQQKSRLHSSTCEDWTRCCSQASLCCSSTSSHIPDRASPVSRLRSLMATSRSRGSSVHFQPSPLWLERSPEAFVAADTLLGAPGHSPHGSSPDTSRSKLSSEWRTDSRRHRCSRSPSSGSGSGSPRWSRSSCRGRCARSLNWLPTRSCNVELGNSKTRRPHRSATRRSAFPLLSFRSWWFPLEDLRCWCLFRDTHLRMHMRSPFPVRQQLRTKGTTPCGTTTSYAHSARFLLSRC